MKMNVIGYDPVLAAGKEPKGVERVDLETIWKRSDMVTLHTPLNADTKGLVNDVTFAKMKKGVFLVNCARGGIVDEAAAKRALDSGHLAGLALDVFVEEPPPADHPLLSHDKVICTPHVGASTTEAQEKVAVDVAKQIAAYLLKGEIGAAVNREAVK
jgi:phosphoglycerate dehydrogenase-like enzyme